ncbi:hypothetical protein BDB00DRAFT_877903 [Zychaea mexicana]|uniref:uncharacterized protein n=1 Tax=Zychaea mexicana TaxID=64656 RepID=UPI0022FE8BE4|nr:uncharacterized protein BDB00DRAFT_877903 [Zychaea mexicana]KAI9487984.1 hypothetical protein BDB00DRAFT_877903 [Zychaea mexicana]
MYGAYSTLIYEGPNHLLRKQSTSSCKAIPKYATSILHLYPTQLVTLVRMKTTAIPTAATGRCNSLQSIFAIFLLQTTQQQAYNKMIKAVLIFLVACLAYVASADSIWCNYKQGGGCLLPGVGPTYDCGRKAGYNNYVSDSGKKYWNENLESSKWKKFEACCHAAGKGACHS